MNKPHQKLIALIKKVDLFYWSLFSGILVWLSIFIVTPANPTNPISFSTLSYLILSFSIFIIGYRCRIDITPKSINDTSYKSFYFLTVLLVSIGFAVRFIDLFFIRNLSFTFDVITNRQLNENNNFLLFSIIGGLRNMFFTPLIFYFLQKRKNILQFLYSLSLFFFPFIEAVLKGSRSPFLISFFLLFIILFYFNKIKFNLKFLLASFLISLILIVISFLIFGNREKNQIKNYSEEIILLHAKYNDLYKPNQAFLKWYNQEDNKALKSGGFYLLQMGQYYNHGVFECNNLVQQPSLKHQYGKYSFYIIPQFFNKIGWTHYDLEKISESHPRGYTFVGFLGELFIDWGWLSLIFLFLFGMVQRIVYEFVKVKSYTFLPLYFFLLFGNFFILSFNFFGGNGTIFLIFTSIFAFYGIINPQKRFFKE